ncbi:hypothetical protein QR98_0025960 [Sarcoptes scabiei]|uniref:Uncharacterized protein n=1 Tax=Sarcoptes scabiei TaxID=52283 RepID=A0A131ZZP1_SARSC|nr:hypothetical protein QR98_0025960 [Sarcoptes scabiei]
MNSFDRIIKTTINNHKRILIEEFLSSTNEQIKAFQTDDLAIEAIFDCLENPERDIELFKSITKRLYEIYCTQDRQLQLIALIFIPTLIGVYLRYNHAHSNIHHNLCKKDSDCETKPEPLCSLAVLLLLVYNIEIIHQKTGDLKTIEVRLISLTKPSIYHEPSSHTSVQTSTVPTEQMLAKINNPNESKITIFGPYYEIEKLNIGNQQSVFTVLMKLYNQYIQETGFYSLQSLCRIYLSLLKQGEQEDIRKRIESILHSDCDEANSPIVPEMLPIKFCSEFLTELMKSVYFCYYNELEDIALELIEEISKRAVHKLYADVLLMVNAFKNTQAIIYHDRVNHLAEVKKTNQSQISLNATPPVSTVTSIASRKKAITNASFKTRKLPDDIPIVAASAPDTIPIVVDSQNSSKNHFKKTHPQHQIVNPSNKKDVRTNANFKNLDSINEESPTSSIQLPQEQSKNIIVKNQQSSKTSRKGVMNILREFKDKPKKSAKNNIVNETNGNPNESILLNQNLIATNKDELVPMNHLKNSSHLEQLDAEKINISVPLAQLELFDDEGEKNDDDFGEQNESINRINQQSGHLNCSSNTTAAALLNSSSNNSKSNSNSTIKIESNGKYQMKTLTNH